MFLKGKRLSFTIGLLLAIVHLFFSMRFLSAIRGGAVGLDAAIIFLFDIFLLPVYCLLDKLFPCVTQFNYQVLIIVYGILGTLSWLFIPFGIARIVKRFTRPKVKE